MPRTRVVRHEPALLQQGEHGALERSLVALGELDTHFDVRYMSLPGSGMASAHSHPWEQGTYVLAGSCKVIADGDEWTLKSGDFVFFESGVHHRFENSSETDPVALLAVRGPRPT